MRGNARSPAVVVAVGQQRPRRRPNELGLSLQRFGQQIEPVTINSVIKDGSDAVDSNGSSDIEVGLSDRRAIDAEIGAGVAGDED